VIVLRLVPPLITLAIWVGAVLGAVRAVLHSITAGVRLLAYANLTLTLVAVLGVVIWALTGS
jgi:hypothetical protein